MGGPDRISGSPTVPSTRPLTDHERAYLSEYLRPVRAERAIQTLERGNQIVTPPSHRDDYRQLDDAQHGRVGASYRYREPSLWRAFSWPLVLAVLAIVAGLVFIAVANR
jgi:hypothetical protein